MNFENKAKIMSPTTPPPPQKNKTKQTKNPALLVTLTILNKFFPLYGHKISNVSKCYKHILYQIL